MAQLTRNSSKTGAPMSLGSPLPDLQVPIHTGENLNLLDAAGNDWLVVFSYPLDKTPICATELITVASLRDEFAKRKAKLVGLSVGTAKEHSSFIADLEESRPDLTFDIPIIADEDGSIAQQLGMVHPLLGSPEHAPSTPRCLYIFTPRGGGVLTGQASCEDESTPTDMDGRGTAPDSSSIPPSPSGGPQLPARRPPSAASPPLPRQPAPAGEESKRSGGASAAETPTLAVSLCYPPSVGRSFREVLRTLDGLRRATEDPSVGTPANWQPGQDVVLLPDISDEDAERKYPAGFASLTPYLRTVRDPGVDDEDSL